MIEATQEDPLVKSNQESRAAIDLTMAVLAKLFRCEASDETLKLARKQIEALCRVQYSAGRLDGATDLGARLAGKS